MARLHSTQSNKCVCVCAAAAVVVVVLEAVVTYTTLTQTPSAMVVHSDPQYHKLSLVFTQIIPDTDCSEGTLATEAGSRCVCLARSSVHSVTSQPLRKLL